MAEGSSLFVPDGSAAGPLAEAIAWLWRLGPVRGSPAAEAVGIGTSAEARELHSLVWGGRLAAAAVLAGEAGPEAGPMPARREVEGVARFPPGVRVEGRFCVFGAGRELVRSSLGAHAVRDGRLLMLGAGSDGNWSRLTLFWVLEALARFLIEVLERPLVMLPPVGCLRLDDFPGTAQHQVEERAKSDRRQRRRARRIVGAYANAGARLNVAVAAQALRGREIVPLDGVWPESVAELARGVGKEVLEPVCHGLLHLDPERLDEGRIEFREFARLDEAEAGRKIDLAIAWHRDHLGTPGTFVAPAWAYSSGALAALAARDLPAWMRPEPGPLVTDGNVHETLGSGMDGLHKLDFGPLERLGAAGLPPTVTLHGGLLDSRLSQLRARRDAVTLARLAIGRDLVRLPGVKGVRWIGARELVERLRAHDQIEVRGRREIFNPTGAESVVQGR